MIDAAYQKSQYNLQLSLLYVDIGIYCFYSICYYCCYPAVLLYLFL